MLLTDLRVGQSGKIVSVSTDSPIYTRLLDIGFTAGTRIDCVLKSPLGDPTAYLIKGTVISLRQEDAALIRIGGR